MRTPSLVSSALASMLLLGSTRAARADVPPDPDSIEAHCTPAEQCPSGVACERAMGDKELGASCRAAAEAKKLERRCGRGATHGADLYCPPGEKGTWSAKNAKEAPKDGAAKSSKGCAIGGDGAEGAALVIAVALLVGMRRRSRTTR